MKKWCYENEGKFVETTTTKINAIIQLSIPTEHNDKTDQFPTCHILQPIKNTWLKAIKRGFFNSVLGINQENVQIIYKN